VNALPLRIFHAALRLCVLAGLTVSASPALRPALDPSSTRAELGTKAAAPYDLVFRNARIVDGTGNPWFTGDVAVRGDRIVAVGRVTGSAKRVIDAKGLVVAPGFIDMHSHSDDVLLEDGDAQSKIRQGVTTEVLGEGESAGPVRQKGGGGERERGRNGNRSWTTLGGYFDTIEKLGVSVNVCSYVGLNSVWRCVMGESFAAPTSSQVREMERHVEQAMREGARGLSSQVMMPPGSIVPKEVVIALAKIAARHGGIYSTHIRNEGTGVFEAVAEAIEVAERAGAALDIIHLKIADQQYWGRMNEVVALIEAARARGLNVQANVYPYTRGNNNLASIIPPWAHEGGGVAMLARLRDPAQRARLKRDIEGGVEGWYNHYTAVGRDWSRMLISADNTERGMTMDKVLAQRGANATNQLDVFLDYLIERGGSVGTVYAHHEERDMNLALVQPWCSVGSDGSAFATSGPLRRGHPHPRNFGSFPRVLGEYVRERKLLRLEDAVRKMTSLNAAKIGIRDRGVIAPGYFADLTVFDPDKVKDRATYLDPFQYNEGIAYVIVNGKVVLDRGKHTGARPGRALRRR